MNQTSSIEDRLHKIKCNIKARKEAIKKKAKRIAFKFKPFSVKQKQILTWWCPESPVKDMDGIIADGAIRSGKTLSMSLSYVMWAMSTFNLQFFGMAGKTISSFRRNVVFWLKLMLRSRGYTVVDHRGDDNYLIISKGEVINYFYIFGGNNERSQDLVQGVTMAGFLFDEVALMPESFVNQATGRCSVDGSKFWFNCNPGNPMHWFKVNWIDKYEEKHLLYLHFTMDDNLSLSEKIKERYRSMYVGVFFKRYIEGIWCVAEGLVYSMFDEDKHVAKEHMKGNLQYVVSIDYGTVNPFSAGLYAFDGRKSQREVEYYYDSRETGIRRDDEAHYKEVCKLIGDRKIEFIIVDPSAASFIETINKYAKYVVLRANNDVLDGIRVTTTFLNKELLKIYQDCDNALNEFGLYAWDMDSAEDAVIKEFDHAMDEIRYYCYTFLRTRLRWRY